METMKDWYRGGDPSKKIPKLLVGLFGGIAGAASVLGNTPLDVVKTRMQSLDAARYKNTLDCAKSVELLVQYAVRCVQMCLPCCIELDTSKKGLLCCLSPFFGVRIFKIISKLSKSAVVTLYLLGISCDQKLN